MSIVAYGLAMAANLAPALAATPAVPMRKPGVWELHGQLSSPMGAGQSVTICVDEKTEKPNTLWAPFSTAVGGCPLDPVVQTPTGWSYSQTCNIDGKTIITKGKIDGDLSASYHQEVVTQSPIGPRMYEFRSVVDGKWLGPCPTRATPPSR